MKVDVFNTVNVYAYENVNSLKNIKILVDKISTYILHISVKVFFTDVIDKSMLRVKDKLNSFMTEVPII